MILQCQKCKKLVRYLNHKTTGKKAPIEVESSEKGNVFVKGNLYRIATPKEIEKAKALGKLLYLNHFATCEYAKSFVKTKS